MTSNDYAVRLERLKAAKEGETVTVPDGWEPPEACPVRARRVLKAGDTLTSDGTGLMEWEHEGKRYWFASGALAKAGLDVDPVDEQDDDDETVGVPAGETEADGEPVPACSCGVCSPPASAKIDPVRVTVSDAVPETAGAILGDFGAAESFGTVSADGVALDEVDEDTADDAAGYQLDEFQSERVAALEQAVRVLESRAVTEPGKARTFGDLMKPSAVPVRDLIDVAAFIAIGETGRLEVSA